MIASDQAETTAFIEGEVMLRTKGDMYKPYWGRIIGKDIYFFSYSEKAS
jgi:hypothetical protein